MSGTRTVSDRRCPRCLAVVGIGRVCAQCGLAQTGARAERLRDLTTRLDELHDRRQQLAAEEAALRRERDSLLAAVEREETPVEEPLGVLPPPVWAEAGPGGPEWKPDRVRDVLLWLGVVLLATAALIFTFVTWTRLGSGGRALLLSATAVFAGALAVASRRRLPATAEALSGLALVLTLVDWFALRRAGVLDGLAVEAWWALGTGLVGFAAFAAAAWTGFRTPRVAGAALEVAAAALTVAITASTPPALAVGCGLAAGVLVGGDVGLRRRPGWGDAAAVLALGALVVNLAAVAWAVAAGVDVRSGGPVAPAALGVLLCGLAPAVAAGSRPAGRKAVTHDLLVGFATVSVMGACATCLAASVAPYTLASVGAGLGLVAVALGRRLPDVVRRGVAGAGAAAVGASFVVVVPDVARAAIGPLDWLSDPWALDSGVEARTYVQGFDGRGLTGAATTAAALLVVAAATAVAAWPGRRPALLARGAAAAIGALAVAGAVAVAPLATGASIRLVLAVELSVAIAGVLLSTALAARAPTVSATLLVLAGALAVPVAGWAATGRGATVLTLGVVTATLAVAGTLRARGPVRTALVALAAMAAAGEAAAVAAALDLAAPRVGLVLAGAGAALLLLGALGRARVPEGPAVEGVGVLAVALGAVVSAEEVFWLAVTLTAVAPCFALAAFREDRSVLYGAAAAAVALAAVWAWLAEADVALVEAYTMPAAVVALGAGALRRRDRAEVRSGLAYGPGLVIGLAPSLALVVSGDGTARPLVLLAAATACVVVGAHRRLRAPLVAGAVTLVVLALDALAPVAAELPRWASIGALGLFLLWLGATTERRVSQLRRWRHDLEQLA